MRSAVYRLDCDDDDDDRGITLFAILKNTHVPIPELNENPRSRIKNISRFG